MLFTSALLVVGALLCSSAHGQAPNTVQGQYPNDRSMSTNGTFFIIPFNKTVLEAVLPKQYTLLDANSLTSLFPNGFEEGKHPLIVSNTYGSGIVVEALGVGLSIPKFLINANIYITCVDGLGDGKTGFIYPYFDAIGGDNGQLDSSIIPALVGSVGGAPINMGTFDPSTAVYSAPDSSQPSLFTTSASTYLVLNPASGPSVANPLFDISFEPTSNSPYTAHTFHSLLSQPEILPSGQCLPEANFFDNEFADPFFTKGTVDLYANTLASDVLPGYAGLANSFAGTYSGVYGYAATAMTVGFNNVNCSAAATMPEILEAQI